MKSNYRTLGELVEPVDVKNTDGTTTELVGLSIDKCFIRSVANTIGTDLSKYKVISKNEFAVSLMQVSRDSKIPVACMKDYETAIMSPAYSIFKVKDEDVILPDYLDMWFKRSEFDREAAFIAVGGVRGSMPWDDFARMEVIVPDIERQRKIVNEYEVITDRIALKERINDNLMEQASALWQHLRDNSDWPFVSIDSIAEKVAMGPFGSNIKVSTFVSSGIPIISGNHLRGYFLDETSFNYITEEHAEKIKNSMVYPYDIVFTHAGNIGQVAMIQDNSKFPRYILSQRQFYLRCNKEKVSPEYVLFFFHSTEGQRELLSYANPTGVPSITQPATNLKKIQLPIPTFEKQTKWLETIKPMINLYLSNKKESESLSRLRDNLLSKQMSGKSNVFWE